VEYNGNRVNALIDHYSRLKTYRTQWESHWQEIRNLVRINTTDFNSSQTRGAQRAENIYDGTAPWSLEQFGAGLHSHLTNPASRWFNLEFQGMDATLDEESLMWLEEVSDLIYFEYGVPETGMNPALHECYMDLGAFGTGVLFQDYVADKQLIVFRCFPLADCFIDESADGTVDTIFRKTLMTSRQVVQKFGEKNVPEKVIKEMHTEKKWEIVHAVFPRSDRDVRKLSKTNMPFASFWFSEECKYIFSESGYHEFPYHVPRWSKLSGEMYGRSPAMTCLPDIKMINQMSKVTIKAAQKAVDPPLMVPDDGFMLPLKTAPSSLMFYQQGTDPIIPLESRGRLDIGLEMMDQRRDHIIKSFFVDWLLQQKNTTEMTATEVMDRREEKLRMMAPMIGRLEGELLSVMIRRTFGLLARANRIPEMPASLQGIPLDLSYSSPAAQAQLGGKAAAIQRFMQDLVPLAEVDPSIMDSLNLDGFARVMADIRDVSRKILRSEAEVDQVRQQRAQQEQAAQMSQMAPAMAGSIKDLAQADQMAMGG